MSSGGTEENVTDEAVSESDATLQGRILHYLGRFIRLLLIGVIYALVLWYGAATAAQLDTPPIPTRIAVVLIAIGITGGIYRFLVDVAKETTGALMVLAEFLNRHLLEPQKRRLINQGRAEGRAEGREEGREEARAEIIAKSRARLIEQGIDPNLIFPLDEETDDTDRADR